MIGLSQGVFSALSSEKAWQPMELDDKALKLTGKRIEDLHRLGLYDTESLLAYYPIRYDAMNNMPFENWAEKDKVTFEGEVVKTASTWQYGKRSTTTFEVMAWDRVLKITIFNRPWASSLRLNQVVTINGIYQGKNRVTALSYDTKRLAEHDAVTPIYSVKAGIRQSTVHACIEKVFCAVVNEIQDIVPQSLVTRYRLLRKALALRYIHFPTSMDEVKQAYRTLKYEEFLRFFTSIEVMRQEEIANVFRPPHCFDVSRIREAIARLPYALTPDQKSALDDILRDMSSTVPMYRLLQGDVGCGKTTVAAFAMQACVLAGRQAALLAPTEILARQHLASLALILKDCGIAMDVLYAGLPAKKKRQVIEDIAKGKIQIVVGTHSLIQEDVLFFDLGLVIADEQQRFGVEQRRAFRKKGDYCDFLLMSATPIPRTLSATLYGDMDISTIESMPLGRKVPITKLIKENSFRSVLDDVKKLLVAGRQLYVICVAIDENEEMDVRNVNDTCAALQKAFGEYRCDMLHGRMNSAQKQEAMDRFYRNEVQILVSTTVVEVGMNVVNATGMIIYDAERFGLSQLHQLRGRIQRGNEQGQCWLLTSSKDSKALERLSVLVKTCNGFEISYEDLRLRGPGDILGTKQSGKPDFILGNVVSDTAIINTARADARVIAADPGNLDYAVLLENARASAASRD